VKSAELCNLEGPLERWRAVRDEIHADVCEKAYNPRMNAFVQAYGSDLADASLLLMPLVGFLPATDPRIRGTVECVEKHLLVDGFVLRYDSAATDDGLPPGEGAFLACSFWLADNYVMLGRRDDAVALFERLLDLRNDVGLLAEGYDPVGKRLVGNFPQAFSHIALLSTAFNLAEFEPPTKRPAEQRGDGTVQK
jgi:GH15 family glucan-1,4-alpha-glucosidase